MSEQLEAEEEHNEFKLGVSDKTLTDHEAQSIYAYIRELENYVENNEGEADLKEMIKSYNKGGKLINGIQKLNVAKEKL